MKVKDIIDCADCELVFVDENNNVLSEGAVRQFKRVGDTLKQKYRCLSGKKKGKLVSHPGGCGVRKDPKKIRQGKKVMRTKKNLIQRKSKITKRKAISKLVTKRNQLLSGK